jgi:hypothetical protein
MEIHNAMKALVQCLYQEKKENLKSEKQRMSIDVSITWLKILVRKKEKEKKNESFRNVA